MSTMAKTWREFRTITFLTIDALFWSKKTIFVALIPLFIVALAILARLVLTYNWIRAPFTPPQVFATLMSTAVIHFLVVFITLFYGTALISEEVEGKTVTYLFLRPIPKPLIMLGKYLALVWITLLLVLPAIVLSYLILYLGPDLGPFFRDMGALAQDLGIVTLAILAYGALFALIGACLRHSILAGLLYAFGWEGIIPYLPGYLRKLTITHYIQSIFPHEDTATAVAMLIGERSGRLESLLTLVLLAVLFLSTASLIVREKEFLIEQ
jgi:ABC-type transport system involved in multi-copper enzyme maturation permease subunit